MSSLHKANYEASLTQCMLKAIELCSSLCLSFNSSKKNIIFLVCCKTVVNMLRNTSCETLTLVDCVKTLNNLAKNNNVTLRFAPKSKCCPIRNLSLKLKEYVENSTVYYNLPRSQSAKTKEGNEWSKKMALKRWNKVGPKLKHSFQRIDTPFNPKLANILLNMNRADLRITLSALTGHAPLRKFLKLINKSDTDRCRFCNCREQPETVAHVFETCNVLERLRHNFSPQKKITSSWILKDKGQALKMFCKESGVDNIINRQQE